MANKTDTLHIRISPDAKHTLRDLAKRKGMTMSEMVEYTIFKFAYDEIKKRVGTTEENDDE